MPDRNIAQAKGSQLDTLEHLARYGTTHVMNHNPKSIWGSYDCINLDRCVLGAVHYGRLEFVGDRLDEPLLTC